MKLVIVGIESVMHMGKHVRIWLLFSFFFLMYGLCIDQGMVAIAQKAKGCQL